MAEILTELSPPSLVTAIKSNLYTFFRAFRNTAHIKVHENAYGFRWHTDIPNAWFNGVLSSSPPTARTSQAIRETMNYFRSHNVKSFTWWLAPHLAVGEWSEQLLAHGFQYDDSTPGMAMNLFNLSYPEAHPLTILRVKDRQTLDRWSHVLVRGFEMPEGSASQFSGWLDSIGTDLPIRHYLGFLDDHPVATSTLFLGAGVAGIYNVATVAEARGQGVGSIMTLAPLYEAREFGYHAGILQSSAMGYGVYKRLGFQKFCEMDHFLWTAPDA